MVDPLTVTISVVSLAISATTAWLTLFRTGTVRMTQPTMIFMGPDGPSGGPKVYLRTLLYSTAKRGRVVENMYVKLRFGEAAQNFSFWVYGEARLFPGCGLFVGSEGVARNHHFALPKDVSFTFTGQKYTLEIYAALVGESAPLLLQSVSLIVTHEQASRMLEERAGILFTWGPDARTYQSHVDIREPKVDRGDRPDFFDLIMSGLGRDRPKSDD